MEAAVEVTAEVVELGIATIKTMTAVDMPAKAAEVVVIDMKRRQ